MVVVWYLMLDGTFTHALWLTKIMPIPTLNTLAFLTQTQLKGHTPLDVRAWELKSGTFCKESFSSHKEFNLV
jgi:hypothetical protein